MGLPRRLEHHMCEKVIIDRMKEKGYYDWWILPDLGLNDNLGSFGGRPVGNSPEFMPGDACLNNDVHESARRHCVLSRSTPKRQGNTNNDREFSMATPQLAVLTYDRLMDPDICTGVVPNSKRILQDIESVWQAMQTVCEHKGGFVGLAAKTGCGYLKSLVKHSWSGYRLKGDASIVYWKIYQPCTQTSRAYA